MHSFCKCVELRCLGISKAMKSLLETRYCEENDLPTPRPKLTSNNNHHNAFTPRRSRHISIDKPPNLLQIPTPPNSLSSSANTPKSGPSSTGYVRVKTQWQKAVRRMSGGSGSGGHSPSAHPDLHERISRSSPMSRSLMERPGWALRQQQQQGAMARPSAVASRTRHLSLNADGVYSISEPADAQQPMSLPPAPQPNLYLPTSVICDKGQGQGQGQQRKLHKADSSPLPSRANPANIPGQNRVHPESVQRRFSQPAGSAAEPTSDVFPFSKAFTYGIGKANPFPCGSEAVMINAALAHEAFSSKVSTHAEYGEDE